MTIYKSYEAAIKAGAKDTDRVLEECGNCEGGNKPQFTHGVCSQCGGHGHYTIQVSVAARNEWNRVNPPIVRVIEELANVHKIQVAIDVLEARDQLPTEDQITSILRIHRELDASTGQCVDADEVAARPETTIRETRKP